MKTFVCVLLCCLFLTNCKAQNSDFKSYLDNFGITNIPLVIRDCQSYHSVFNQRYDSIFHETYKEIPENLVTKYIFTNGFCNSDSGYFRYDYGVKIALSSDFISVLVSKLQYEGDSEWNFDLGETLLITYNNKGKILSRLSLTKDNDRWQSCLKITKQGITVRQIKITEPKIDQYHRDLRCEYWTTTYQIATDGIIKTIDTSPVSIGIVIWDKVNEEYILKE
ncbi:hypothetical protein SDC9_69531 [bioreactor metagenome]|jgi:hypothetical protein|uniref:Lipoprotein n=2 Tax=root TaxID=1 RepID=A0A069DD09_9BACE|nr:hypothetical protein [Bacteroides graminisolvens]GAK38239.1 hypothetical protein JCM15093_3564 [Bacteroides graminisolvens DSM 19988 = JCM 15093]